MRRRRRWGSVGRFGREVRMGFPLALFFFSRREERVLNQLSRRASSSQVFRSFSIHRLLAVVIEAAVDAVVQEASIAAEMRSVSMGRGKVGRGCCSIVSCRRRVEAGSTRSSEEGALVVMLKG
jgi:hypothetical protein